LQGPANSMLWQRKESLARFVNGIWHLAA